MTSSGIILDTFDPDVDGTIDYGELPDHVLAWYVLVGDPQALAESDRRETEVASAFHLPGKHNQKTHGRGGGGSWKRVDNAKVEEENYQKLRQEMHGIYPAILDEGEEAWLQDMVRVPAGTRIYELGDGKIRLQVSGRARLTDANITAAQKTIENLNRKFPVTEKVDVHLDPAGSFPVPELTLGETTGNSIRINDLAFNPGYSVEGTGLAHPAAFYRDPAGATIAHEWGHVVENTVDPDAVRSTFHDNFEGVSRYAQNAFSSAAPSEGFAECFADFAMGDHSLPATTAYAKQFGWVESA
jgi:hypothetical protein